MFVYNELYYLKVGVGKRGKFVFVIAMETYIKGVEMSMYSLTSELDQCLSNTVLWNLSIPQNIVRGSEGNGGINT
jgi:hypothetical protein